MLTEFVKDRGNEDIPITAITEEMFEEFRFFLKKREYAASTINRYLCWWKGHSALPPLAKQDLLTLAII